jgi:two-component system, sensor histidine kinase and response regulator
MKKHTLFSREDQVIERCKKIMDNGEFGKNSLCEDYAQLSADYSKLFRQFSRIVRISDKTQEQLRESQESITQYNKELKELNATKDKFFSIIAHDLKSPFQAFLNLNTFLVDRFDRYSKEEIIELITEMGDTADNLFKLLENLLSWSRIQMGKMLFEPNVFPLDQLVNMTMGYLEASAKAKQIQLEGKIPEFLEVYVDPDMFSAVLRNLISNAIKFTKPGGTVKVSAKEMGDRVEIAVTDSGVGISESVLEKLFKIDTTCSTPGTANEKGTGLGLILCKEMVEKHGGNIRVESEVDVGTTFIFTMNMNPPDPQ